MPRGGAELARLRPVARRPRRGGTRVHAGGGARAARTTPRGVRLPFSRGANEAAAGDGHDRQHHRPSVSALLLLAELSELRDPRAGELIAPLVEPVTQATQRLAAEGAARARRRHRRPKRGATPLRPHRGWSRRARGRAEHAPRLAVHDVAAPARAVRGAAAARRAVGALADGVRVAAPPLRPALQPPPQRELRRARGLVRGGGRPVGRRAPRHGAGATEPRAALALGARGGGAR